MQAFHRRFRPLVDIAAIPAVPLDYFVLFENRSRFDVDQKLSIAFLVLLFDLGDLFEYVGDFLKTFFPGYFFRIFVERGPFHVFAIS